MNCEWLGTFRQDVSKDFGAHESGVRDVFGILIVRRVCSAIPFWEWCFCAELRDGEIVRTIPILTNRKELDPHLHDPSSKLLHHAYIRIKCQIHLSNACKHKF